MTSLLVSTVAFKSNLAVVKDRQIKYDKEFLAKIKDHFALEKMKACNIPLTPAQEDIYEKVSLHCVYAPEGDYPFGTVIENGGEKVKCKCENTRCKYYAECRPEKK